MSALIVDTTSRSLRIFMVQSLDCFRELRCVVPFDVGLGIVRRQPTHTPLSLSSQAANWTRDHDQVELVISVVSHLFLSRAGRAITVRLEQIISALLNLRRRTLYSTASYFAALLQYSTVRRMHIATGCCGSRIDINGGWISATNHYDYLYVTPKVNSRTHPSVKLRLIITN